MILRIWMLFALMINSTSSDRMLVIDEKLKQHDFKEYLIDASSSIKIVSNLYYSSLGEIKEKVLPPFTHSAFYDNVHNAYNYHIPLEISVSDIQMLLNQAVGIHLLNNRELQDAITSHSDKKDLDIFILSWNSTHEFVKEIAEKFTRALRQDIKVPELIEILTDDYSISTEMSSLVSRLIIMDVFKVYYNYNVFSLCGIPNVKLKGSQEDWLKLQGKVEKLIYLSKSLNIGLDYFLEGFLFITKKLVYAVVNEEIDITFWKSIYKLRQESGGQPVNGWINALYYTGFMDNPDTLSFLKRHYYFRNDEGIPFMSKEIVPPSIFRTPFKLDGKDYIMNSGIIGGVYDHNDGYLKSRYFYAITSSIYAN